LSGDLNERLTTGGFRFTPQREHVYNVLLKRSAIIRPAEEIFLPRQTRSRTFHGHGLQLP